MKKKTKKLIIIAGANGVGKTTLAKELLKEYKIGFLNADEIARKIDKNLIEGRIKAGKRFIISLNKLVKGRESFAVESTLSGKSLLKVVKKVKRIGYKISIIYFFIDNPKIAIARIAARVEAGGHNIPEEDVVRRFYRSKDNFWKLYKNLADEWTVFYNGLERLVPVVNGEKKDFTVFDKALFAMFKGIKDDK